MIEQVWIFSHYRGRWTNGKHIISQEVITHYPWSHIRDIVYNDWDIVLCKDVFRIPSHRDLKYRLAEPWQPPTPEEIIRILGDDTGNSLGNRS